MQSFRRIDDKRRSCGKRYKLESVLGLVATGFMHGCTSLRAIWKPGLHLNKTKAKRLGFTGFAMPSYPTIINILKAVDPIEFEETCGKVVRSLSENQFTHIAIDGKSIRSTSDTKNGLLHLVSAFAPEVSGTLVQVKSGVAGGEIVAARSIIAKAFQSCYVVAPRSPTSCRLHSSRLVPKLNCFGYISQLDMEDKVITADSLFAGERLCSERAAKGGDYVFEIKQNRKRVRDDIIQGICYHRSRNLPVKSFSTEVNKAYGRIESRSIEVIDVTNEKNFGGMTTIKQIAAITRNYCNTRGRSEKSETTYINLAVPQAALIIIPQSVFL